MFEYDVENSMYRCVYAHDPGVDLMRGVGGDVAKIKSPLVYTFLDSKGDYVVFHDQLHCISARAYRYLCLQQDQQSSRCGRSYWAEGGLLKGYMKCLTTAA
jgi:hypothetical protein